LKLTEFKSRSSQAEGTTVYKKKEKIRKNVYTCKIQVETKLTEPTDIYKKELEDKKNIIEMLKNVSIKKNQKNWSVNKRSDKK
jgi:hypothetical protein